MLDDSTSSEYDKCLNETASLFEPLGYSKDDFRLAFYNLRLAATRVIYEERCSAFSASFSVKSSNIVGKRFKVSLVIGQHDKIPIESFSLSCDI